MREYDKDTADLIIGCLQENFKGRNHDALGREHFFKIGNDGVWPVKPFASDCPEFDMFDWKPSTDLDDKDEERPNPASAPGLPIPFTANELAAFMIYGVGSYITDAFGGWDDGPDERMLECMGINADWPRSAIRGAFNAYRTAKIVVGQCDEAPYSVWRRKIVNQLLTGTVSAPNGTALAQVPLAPPVVTVGASNGTGWAMVRPKRYPGYRKPLYDLMKAALIAGQPCPNARDVLDAWKLNPPLEVFEVTNDGLKYYDANGNAKSADLAAIRRAIERMTT